ncbi:hypothetical protein CAPTEDRAFT_184849 [Capitella teleta]|uniref:Uncharacterized protein n=1 Tax=Capitella teleta TaxID=283909 RepID=X1ZH59_CAPTE|nr:hypothetical protein CAPTEDRAFT_184849 [Capitella teleta]|eukprot:ELT90063.1 hypothetical protein CAPTEDRAFT_184849 [Capitella teleta]
MALISLGIKKTLSLLPFVCFDDCLAMPIEKLCSQVGRLPPLPRDVALTWSPSAERKKPLPPIQRKKEPLSGEHFLIPYQPFGEVSGPLLSPCGDSSTTSTDSSSLTCVSALSSPSEASSSASSSRPESPDPLDDPIWLARFQNFPLLQPAPAPPTGPPQPKVPRPPTLPAPVLRRKPRVTACPKPQYLPRRGNPGRMTEYQRMLNARPATRRLLY